MARLGYTVDKKLIDQATEVVKAAQEVSYEGLRAKFPNIGTGTLSLLMKALLKRKVIRQTDKRRYVVIVNADGLPKNESSLPPARRFRRAKFRKDVAAQPTNGNGAAIEDREKLDMLTMLSKATNGKGARVLNAIADDVRVLAKHRKLLEALGG